LFDKPNKKEQFRESLTLRRKSFIYLIPQFSSIYVQLLEIDLEAHENLGSSRFSMVNNTFEMILHIKTQLEETMSQLSSL